MDWIMSLEPRWHSTVFPLALLSGNILAGYCLILLLLRAFADHPPFSGIVTNGHYHQLGNLVLTFVLFWSYLAFSQLLIIYSANKPEEISWYLHRITNGWNWVIIGVAVFHFFLPFLVLLFRGFKQSGAALASLAAWLLVVHLIYTYWIIKPSFGPFAPNWMDLAAPIGIGGIWIGAFLWLLKRAPLVPLNDPRIREEIAHAKI
jgi:hypothetical protein